MKVQLVTSLRDFDALAPVWREVARAGGQLSPFASHDWFACCWRFAGPDRRREVWLFHDSGAPVALVPLSRSRTRVRGFPVRRIEFLDSPDTGYTDFPRSVAADDVVDTLLATLSTRRDWDMFALPKLRRDGKLLRALERGLRDRYAWRVATSEVSPYLALTGTWEEFVRNKTPRFRKTYRNIENRVERSGKVEVEEHRHVSPSDSVFAEMLRVSEESWKAPKGVAMATMLGAPRFFRELTQRASANGSLHLWILRVDGRPLATEYQLRGNGVLHALRADYDSSMASLSPGAYLNAHIVRSLFERRDLNEYDMGPGAKEYKLRWATGEHELVGLEVFAPTTYGRLLHRVQTRLVPFARRWRARMQNTWRKP